MRKALLGRRRRDRRGAQVARRSSTRWSSDVSQVDYRQSGVDIDAGNEAVRRIKALARETYTAGVLSGVGSFGGLFALDRDVADPVLVASADGVGTKLKVAFMAGVHDTIGVDLVNHCVNDILVQGARAAVLSRLSGHGPVGAGCGRTDRARRGGGPAATMAARCSVARPRRCPGSTRTASTMSRGSSSASVSRSRIIDGRGIVAGDVLIALPSSGLHTNGYSLARRIVFDELGLASTVTCTSSARRSARPCCVAPIVSAGRRAAARSRLHQGDGAHHGRRDHREPAAGAAGRARLLT